MSNLSKLSIEQITKMLENANASLVKLENTDTEIVNYPYRDEKNKVLKTLDNFKALKDYLGVSIRYNEMSKEQEIFVPGFKQEGALYNNAVIGKLVSLCNEYRFPLGKDMLMDFVTVIAHDNSYHPVRDWIDSVVWDGRSRLQEYYDSIVLKNPNPMKETMMRKWAISCVAALYHPGYSCEGVLTLCGLQGLGKTTWIEMLIPSFGKNRWNKDGIILDTKDKDSLIKALAYWISELGEIDATFKKSDIEALKAFITEKQDVIRPPYERKPNAYPRQTTFYASVNEVEFLHDTENRRFWVLEIQSFNYNNNFDAAQFWAEIKQIYLSIAHKIDTAANRQANNEWGWFMSPTEREQMKKLQEVHRSSDPVDQKLQSGLVSPTLTKGKVILNATEILERLGWTKPTKSDINKAAKWLRSNKVPEERDKKWNVQFNKDDLNFDDDKISSKILTMGKKTM